MFEDHGVEARVLPVGRVLSVASAGDTAFALASLGSQVTAVDVSSAQLRYVEDRLAGGPVRLGSADRLLALGRSVLLRTGWRHADLEDFCHMDDPAAQLEVWRDRLDTSGFRLVLGATLSPGSVRGAGFSAFTSSVQDRFDVLMRERLAAGVATHPNRSNPFLRRLLLGRPVPTPAPEPGSVRLVQADLLDHLEAVPPASYDGFTLSNVLDGTGAEYASRLTAAVHRAAAPGAVAVYRSFRRTSIEAAAQAATDRSMLWGSVRVEQVGAAR
jgi:hypothetical protein